MHRPARRVQFPVRRPGDPAQGPAPSDSRVAVQTPPGATLTLVCYRIDAAISALIPNDSIRVLSRLNLNLLEEETKLKMQLRCLGPTDAALNDH